MPDSAPAPALADELCRIARLFGERQWCLATSGNFSARAGSSHCLITQSGRNKSDLSADDLMLCDLDGNAVESGRTPSAETALHTGLYRHDHDIGAVLHTHSVTATVLSRSLSGDFLVRGLEMQKAIRGVSSHDEQVTVAVFDNTQDMSALAAEVARCLDAGVLNTPCFLVRGHGLYTWGRDLAEAERHTEGLEFLMACAWQERLAAR